ncbi:superoxide dismutase family protein [Nitratireductor sp. ZSWI3]|uniref:superoxide dismutase family protein n=1 Tax=Nitratireductor sp. ZSWI3 TaxID=2966359 RepID=UPI00214F8109|nr:superoxide dismutase family protein [Nitratireductor sp. ZSWI3]MCR4264687.1 superoxide dismutase family protein [Nitratireductor sp. ZSWI3]
MKRIVLSCVLVIPLAAAQAAEGDTATAELKGEGIVGNVEMREAASGVVHVIVSAKGVPEGPHGFHVHETGACDPGSGFESAGGHLARGEQHGIKAEGGPHPGDFPNVHAGSDGVVEAEFFTRGFNLGQDGEERLLDQDGAAVVLHAKADDYTSQPSGEAGDRLACGVLEPKP